MEIELVKSYLQARDPSIMAYNRTDMKEIKVNLGELMESNDTEVEEQTESEEDKCIHVYLRIRGDVNEYALYEIDGSSLICNVPEGSFTFRNVKSGDSMKRNYSFTKIFGPEYDQQTIFNYIIKPKVLSFINGRSSTIFTYGASGSGKTFTIVGTPEEPGLIPRALEYMFRSIPKVSQMPDVQLLPNGSTQYFSKSVMEMHEQYKNSIIDTTIVDDLRTYKRMQERLSSEPVAKVEDDPNVSVSVWVSFAEIYNEIIYDLLSLPAARNQPRQRLVLGKSQGNTFIKKLTYLNVRNGLEAYQILQYGLHNLNYAATAINSHSSRSHCIFTVSLLQTSKCSNDVYVSNFNFCDLAGSERLKKTNNFGDRLKESNNINTSLLVLGRCMENIRKCQQIKDSRLIPFRESKLTQIFQNALLGHENVEMIVNINPSRNMFDETVHVLNFSAIAKTVIVKEELPKPIKKETRFSLLMKAENSPRLKEIVSNKLEVEKLKKKYNRAKEEIRRLQTVVNRLNEELREGLTSDEKSEEIKHLHRAIDKIIDERDSVIQIYEKKLVKNTDHLSAIYEESIARYIEMHKKDKEEAIQRIRKEYEERIAEMQVITISSSDEEDDSPKKSNSKSQTKELKDRILYYQNLVGEMSDGMRELREALKDKEDLLEEAKEGCALLELDIESYRKKYNEEKSETVMLREQIELLTLELQKRSDGVVSEECSDIDDNEIENHEQETNSFVIAPKIEPKSSHPTEFLTLEIQKRSIGVASEASSDIDDNDIENHEQESNGKCELINTTHCVNVTSEEHKNSNGECNVINTTHCLNITSGGHKNNNGKIEDSNSTHCVNVTSGEHKNSSGEFNVINTARCLNITSGGHTNNNGVNEDSNTTYCANVTSGKHQNGNGECEIVNTTQCLNATSEELINGNNEREVINTTFEANTTVAVDDLQ